MPTYRITAPNGKTYQINGPAGATDEQVRAEVMRQNPDIAEYQATRNRIAKSDATYQRARQGAGLKPEKKGVGDAFSLGAGNIIPIQDEIAGGLSGLRQAAGALVHGRDVGAAFKGGYAAGKDAKQEDINATKAQHPIAYNAGGILAGLGKPSASAAPIVETGSKILQTGKNAAKAAGAGGLLGGLVGGADAEGGLGERAKGAARGAGLGAALGGGLSLAGDTLVIPGAKAATRIANKVAGGRLLDPNRMAAQRLTEAMKADGLTPAQIKTAMNEWLKNGNTPQLMNLAGENTRRLIRAAAGKGGEAGAVAAGNVETLAADLQGNAISRTRALTPEKRTAQIVSDAIKAKRTGLADVQYKAPYSEPVQVDEGVISALSDEPGKAALRRARTAAVARRNAQQVAEIDQMLAALETGGDLPQVSGGALDRVKIAMGGRGAKMNQGADTRDIAGGLFERANDIDAALDAVPALQPARQTYRGMTAQGDALDLGGSNAFNNPDEYIQALRDKIAMATPVDNPFPVSGDDIRGAAGVGLARDIERQIGAPTEGATGFLNKLSTGTNQRRVLEETFPGQAEQYREAINQLVSQLNDARFISPNHGSQTALRLEDAGLIDAIPTSKAALLAKLVDAIKSGASITDAEREAIVRLGIASPADLMGLQIGPGLLDRVSPALRQLGASSSAQTGRGQ